MTMALSISTFFDVQAATPAQLPSASGSAIALLSGTPIEVFSCRPESCEPEGILLVFAGYRRNAEDYLGRAVPLAERACLSVYAPRFDAERFPRWRYQWGGSVRRGDPQAATQCMGAMISELIAWARAQDKRADRPVYLFGHSAGAQLLSRVAAYCPPLDVQRIVIANPAAHVAATMAEDAPYGFAGLQRESPSDEWLKSYLAQPVSIYLGTRDKGSRNLDDSAAARRQGRHRFERGVLVYAQARRLAEARGWPFNWTLVEAAGVGHSASGMLRARQVVDALGLCELSDNVVRLSTPDCRAR